MIDVGNTPGVDGDADQMPEVVESGAEGLVKGHPISEIDVEALDIVVLSLLLVMQTHYVGVSVRVDTLLFPCFLGVWSF